MDDDDYHFCFGTVRSDSEQSNKKFTITYQKGHTYTIKAYKDTNYKLWRVQVTDEYTPIIQLKSTVDSWRGTDYESGSGTSADPYVWTWNKTQLKGLANGSTLAFQLYDAGGSDKWYGASTTDTELTNDTWSSTSVSTDNHNWYTTYGKGTTYTIQAYQDGSQWKVKYIRNDEDHDYYWVSPEITNNQKWEYFKMVPSRNRTRDGGDGKTSDKFFSFTIKDCDLQKWDGTALSPGTKIQWYVVRDDDAKWFRPVSDIDKGTSFDGTYSGYGANNEFQYCNFFDCGTTTARTGCFSFNKGATTRSYTFILNAKPSGTHVDSGTNSGNLFVDCPAYSAPSTSSNNYYLIGNFTSAKDTESIDITNTSHPMTRTEYADSVVYSCTVSRPDGGWGSLYLDINPSGNTDWNAVYRPLISLGNNLDGRALVGALTKCKAEQSLNPEPSDFYSGYTFRFNATTMTYQLEFHTSLYIVGPGVTADGKGGIWDLTSSNPVARIPLEPTQENNHFRNTVTFTKGGKFRFLLTEDENTTPTYKVNWGEDSNAPKWASLLENENHFAGSDTQYKNYLLYTNQGSESSTTPFGQGKDIEFDLPNGEYVINFYNYASPYYTIERKGEMRDYDYVIYKNQRRYILGRGETGTGNHDQRDFTNAYKHFCVWSDYIAWNKPDDVDVYALTAFSPSGSHTATVTLSKQNISYIPAKKAVILAMKTDKDKLKGGMVYDAVTDAEKPNNTGFNKVIMDMTPYSDPSANLNGVGVEQFKPLYESTELKRYDDATNTANYLFGFYHANHVVAGNTFDNADFLLGFWQTTGNGSTYPNSGFLQLTREQADMLGVGAQGVVPTQNGAGAPAFLLLFDDEDPSIVTGIRDLDAEVSNVKDSADDHWYTLSGVRIAQPTAKGIYIHGGKKVIVR